MMNILLTGNWRDAEMVHPLAKTVALARFVEWDDQVRASRVGNAPEPLDLIVVAQVRRNEFRQADLDAVVQRYPLAATVVVFGPCCEGERRSGNPMQRVHRVAIGEWSAAFEMFCREFNEKGTSAWHIPEGIGPLESVSRPAALREQYDSISGRQSREILIVADDHRMRETLCDVLGASGWTAVSTGQRDQAVRPGLLLVDCRESIAEALPWCERFGRDVPVVALLGFPRQADRDLLARLADVSEVVAKPFTNELLLQSIRMAASAPHDSEHHLVHR